MARFVDGLYISDELNVYLTANGLKPASSILMTTLFLERAGYDLSPLQQRLAVKTGDDILLIDEDVHNLRSRLEEIGLVYKEDKSMLVPVYETTIGKPVNVERLGFYIAMTKENLESVLNARNDAEAGLAYGYPREAVFSVERANRMEEMKRAKMAGRYIPDWLAYITHVPESLDLVARKVSDSSMSMGLRYRDFVRSHNPELARRVEQNLAEEIESL